MQSSKSVYLILIFLDMCIIVTNHRHHINSAHGLVFQDVRIIIIVDGIDRLERTGCASRQQGLRLPKDPAQSLR